MPEHWREPDTVVNPPPLRWRDAVGVGRVEPQRSGLQATPQACSLLRLGCVSGGNSGQAATGGPHGALRLLDPLRVPGRRSPRAPDRPRSPVARSCTSGNPGGRARGREPRLGGRRPPRGDRAGRHGDAAGAPPGPGGSYFSDGDRASGVFGVPATGFSVLLGFIIFLAFSSDDGPGARWPTVRRGPRCSSSRPACVWSGRGRRGRPARRPTAAGSAARPRTSWPSR